MTFPNTCNLFSHRSLKLHVKLWKHRWLQYKLILLCGSIVDMTSFSDITSWQKWSPMLARMYFAVSRSRPTTFLDKGSHRLIASGSYLFGVKKPSSRSIPCLLNCSLMKKGEKEKKNPHHLKCCTGLNSFQSANAWVANACTVCQWIYSKVTTDMGKLTGHQH